MTQNLFDFGDAKEWKADIKCALRACVTQSWDKDLSRAAGYLYDQTHGDNHAKTLFVTICFTWEKYLSPSMLQPLAHMVVGLGDDLEKAAICFLPVIEKTPTRADFEIFVHNLTQASANADSSHSSRLEAIEYIVGYELERLDQMHQSTLFQAPGAEKNKSALTPN